MIKKYTKKQYEKMNLKELERANDALGKIMEDAHAERDKLIEVRNFKLKVDQVKARYGDKVKAEDVDFLRAAGMLPKDKGTVIVPGAAVGKLTHKSPKISGK